jgi:hypothetical protein
MVQLSDDELRKLIATNEPDAILDDGGGRAKPPPSSARPVANRKDLADKLARLHGLDAAAEPPPELRADESVFGGRKVEGPRGQREQSTIYSAETGEAIAEQG